MAVVFEKRRLGATPALIGRPSSAALPLPTVLWFHGFTAGKATHRPELTALAEAGFLAVGIDAAGHGERRLADFEERFSGTKEETDREFYALVAATAAEVPEILDLLCGLGLADEERIGAAGVSMGGMITYGAAATDLRIRAAVALLATPEWPHPASPHLKSDRFFPTALLSIAGRRPAGGSRTPPSPLPPRSSTPGLTMEAMERNRPSRSLALALICLAVVAAAGFSAWVFAAPPATSDRAEMDRSFRKRVDTINFLTRARLISVAELQEKMKKGERVVILDVREPKEMQVSALPGARLAVPVKIETMPLTEIPADATVVTYCTVGGRSGKAAVLLERRLGRPVYNLDGGIVEWFNRGGEVVDPSGQPVDRIDAWGEPWSSFVHPR